MLCKYEIWCYNSIPFNTLLSALFWFSLKMIKMIGTSLKWKCHHSDEIVTVGWIRAYYFDNFQGTQWWNSGQHEDVPKIWDRNMGKTVMTLIYLVVNCSSNLICSSALYFRETFLFKWSKYNEILFTTKWKGKGYIDGLVNNCSDPSALAMVLLQSCTKPATTCLELVRYTSNYALTLTH